MTTHVHGAAAGPGASRSSLYHNARDRNAAAAGQVREHHRFEGRAAGRHGVTSQVLVDPPR